MERDVDRIALIQICLTLLTIFYSSNFETELDKLYYEACTNEHDLDSDSEAEEYLYIAWPLFVYHIIFFALL